MKSKLIAPRATLEQRRCAAAAAAMVFAVKGLAADAAQTGLRVHDLDVYGATPAQGRAAAMRKEATLIADRTWLVKSSGAAPFQAVAMLRVTP